MPLGFDLVRQSREQATVSKTHANTCMSVGGHALPPHPLILNWLISPSPPSHLPLHVPLNPLGRHQTGFGKPSVEGG